MKRISLIILSIALGACGSSGGGGDTAGNPGILQFGSPSYDITEGEVVNIIVTRSGGSSGVVSVDYETSIGTAVWGWDFTGMRGTLTWADGISGNQTISIPINDDGIAELSEWFSVTLSNVSGATLGAIASATVNITNFSAALPITGDNAQDITVGVLEAITTTIDIIDILDVIGLPVISGTNSGLAKALAADITTIGVACDNGDAAITWNDADNNLTISTGDTFDIVFNLCFFEDSGMTVNGPTSLTNLIVSGDPFALSAPWSLALTFGFDNLSGADMTGQVFVDGDLDLELSSEDNLVVNLAVATDSLTQQKWGVTATLSDYALTETINLSTLRRVVSADGTFTSDLIEGSVTIETLQDFIIIDDDDPSAGRIFISDSSSSVLVTVLGNISVQLDIDFDLDGMIDETIVVTWSELDIG